LTIWATSDCALVNVMYRKICLLLQLLKKLAEGSMVCWQMAQLLVCPS